MWTCPNCPFRVPCGLDGKADDADAEEEAMSINAHEHAFEDHGKFFSKSFAGSSAHCQQVLNTGSFGNV